MHKNDCLCGQNAACQRSLRSLNTRFELIRSKFYFSTLPIFLGEKNSQKKFWRKSLIEIVLEVLMHNFSDSERKSRRKNPFRLGVGNLKL